LAGLERCYESKRSVLVQLAAPEPYTFLSPWWVTRFLPRVTTAAGNPILAALRSDTYRG